MKYYNYLILLLILLLALFCTNGGNEVTGTISETDIGVIGQIVSSEGKHVKGVNVVINYVDSLNKITPVDTIQTNDTGYYNFINLSTGRYRIEGFKNIDSLKFVVLGDEFEYDSITFSDSSIFVGVDTLLAPGAVKGVVLVEGGNHLGSDIYIPGTSYSAKADSFGNFIISGVPSDSSYTLIFSSLGYVTEAIDSVIVNIEDTTIIKDTIVLNYDPDQTPPPPANLVGEFDTINNVVNLSWDTVAHPNLAGFIVYRKDSLESAVEPIVISGNSLINSKTFIDTINEIENGDTVIFQYQVKSQDNKNDKSGFSWPVFVHVWDVGTDSIYLPSKPILQTPTNDTVINSTKVDLIWSSSDVNVSYIVYFNSDSLNIKSVASDTTNKQTSSISSLKYDNTYYWLITAFNDSGSVDSDIFKFATKEFKDTNTTEKPDTPVVINIADGDTVDTMVTVKWNDCGDSVEYLINISEDSLSLYTDTFNLTTDTFFVFRNLLFSTTYYYQIKAKNSNATVESKVYKFTIKDDSSLNPKMILIVGGTFIDQYDRSATVDSFYLMEHEVTVEMYKHFDPGYVNVKGLSEANVPVASVAWGDAIRFANWLSKENNLDSCYIHNDGKTKKASSLWWEYDTLFYEYDTSANGFRLPTGDEWEWAAQGGKENYDYGTDDGTIDTTKAWLMGKSSGSDGPRPVKSYAPNPLGLYDITGNVWESVWDNGFTKPSGRNNYIVSSDSANTEFSKRGDGFLEGLNVEATVKVSKQVGGSETGYSNYDLGFRLGRNK